MIIVPDKPVERIVITEGYRGCTMRLILNEEKPSLKHAERVSVQYTIEPMPPFSENDESNDYVIRKGQADFYVYAIYPFASSRVEYLLYWGRSAFVKVGERLSLSPQDVASQYNLPVFAQAESTGMINLRAGQSVYRSLIEAAKGLKAYHVPIWSLTGLELVPILSEQGRENNISMLISPYNLSPAVANEDNPVWNKTVSTISNLYSADGYATPGLVVKGRYEDKYITAIVMEVVHTWTPLRMMESRLYLANILRRIYPMKPPKTSYTPPSPTSPDLDFSLEPPPLPSIPSLPPLSLPSTSLPQPVIPEIPPMPPAQVPNLPAPPQANAGISTPPAPPAPPVNANVSVPTSASALPFPAVPPVVPR
ncbi:MAG: hypothetical protein QW815_04025 [Nitrososphaerota archaeon]